MENISIHDRAKRLLKSLGLRSTSVTLRMIETEFIEARELTIAEINKDLAYNFDGTQECDCGEFIASLKRNRYEEIEEPQQLTEPMK